MDDALWSDDELRIFISALRSGGFFGPGVDDTDRERFIRQARLRIAPDVQRRLLAEIGTAADASGIARAAFDVLEDESWGKRRTWLVVTPDPWGLLVDLVTREIRISYRASVRRRRSDDRTLEGIAKASSRAELTVADGESDADAEDTPAGPARP